MTLEYVANEDLEVSFSNLTGPPDLTGGADQTLSAQMTAGTSTHCKAGGKFICTGTVDAVWLTCPFASATYNFVSGIGQIAATAAKVKADNVLALRAGDAGACAGSWTLKVSPFTVQTCSCNIEIANAGQDKVKAQ